MDTKEIEQAMKGLIREGKVSSVNAANCTARVTFEDKDDVVSAELPITGRGAARNKDYWLPDVDDVVICLFATNDKKSGTGWIISTRFNAKNPPQVQDENIRRFDFSDGTYFEYDRKKHELTIECKGDIKLNGKNIYFKGENIYLNE